MVRQSQPAVADVDRGQLQVVEQRVVLVGRTHAVQKTSASSRPIHAVQPGRMLRRLRSGTNDRSTSRISVKARIKGRRRAR